MPLASAPVTVGSGPDGGVPAGRAILSGGDARRATGMGDDLGHRGDGVRHVAIGHGGVERQGEDPVRGVLGHRKLARQKSEAVAVEWLQVERAEVHTSMPIFSF